MNCSGGCQSYIFFLSPNLYMVYCTVRNMLSQHFCTYTCTCSLYKKLLISINIRNLVYNIKRNNNCDVKEAWYWLENIVFNQKYLKNIRAKEQTKNKVSWTSFSIVKRVNVSRWLCPEDQEQWGKCYKLPHHTGHGGTGYQSMLYPLNTIVSEKYTSVLPGIACFWPTTFTLREGVIILK